MMTAIQNIPIFQQIIVNYHFIVAVGTYLCAKAHNGTYYVPKCQKGT